MPVKLVVYGLVRRLDLWHSREQEFRTWRCLYYPSQRLFDTSCGLVHGLVLHRCHCHNETKLKHGLDAEQISVFIIF